MTTTPPVACTLTPGQLRCQSAELLPGLTTRASARKWTENGLRLSFTASSDNLAAIMQTVDRERVCCAFLSFEILVPAAGGEVQLNLSGPPGTLEFLRSLGLEAADQPASDPSIHAHASAP